MFGKEYLNQDNYFAKPEVSNVEISIFLSHLTAIFKTLMIKLDFAATLPLILSDQEILEILNKEDLKEIHSAFDVNSHFTENIDQSIILHSLQSIENINQPTVSFESSTTNELNESLFEYHFCETIQERVNVYNALQILLSNPLIYQKSKKYQKDISKSTLNFLRQIKYFMEFIISKTQLLPQEAREKELHIRNLISKTERIKREIFELTKSLEEQKCKHRMEAQELSKQVDINLENWQTINEVFQSRQAKILKDSEDNLAASVEEFKNRMNDHRQYLHNFKVQVDNERMKIRKLEEEVKGKKFKVESQLVSLISKFDTEVSDRQSFYEELTKEYEALEKERLQLMDEMDKQMDIYEDYKKQKEDREFEAYREQYTNFVQKRCAKIIQKWWRKIYAKIKKQKGKKKGKKK